MPGDEADWQKKLRMSGVDIDYIIDGKNVDHGGAVNTFDALSEAWIIKQSFFLDMSLKAYEEKRIKGWKKHRFVFW